jgi:hypothetical protein
MITPFSKGSENANATSSVYDRAADSATLLLVLRQSALKKAPYRSGLRSLPFRGSRPSGAIIHYARPRVTPAVLLPDATGGAALP